MHLVCNDQQSSQRDDQPCLCNLFERKDRLYHCVFVCGQVEVFLRKELGLVGQQLQLYLLVLAKWEDISLITEIQHNLAYEQLV